MTFVVDTNVIVDHLRRHDPATAALDAAIDSGRRLTSSVLARVELARGARHQQAARMAEIEALVEWVPVDHEIAAIAATHAERFGLSHGAGVVDYVIAATAQRLDADLLTRNVRDFPMFPDLEPPY